MSLQLPLFSPKVAASVDVASPDAPADAASMPVAGERPPAMSDHSLDYCVLGSGSGGNCAIVRIGREAILIDAGFGPRRTAAWLSNAGVLLENVKAVCVTHLDRDHFRPTWIKTLVGFGIRVCVHRWHLPDLRRVENFDLLDDAGLVHVFDDDPFEPIAGLATTCVHLPHDHKGTVGFVIDSGPVRIGHATDLGHVPTRLIDRFSGVDLMAIESNYDPDLQLASSRPSFLKKRIMGGKGHLSNDEAYDAVRRVARISPTGLPQHVVLLHRSADCNSSKHVLRAFENDPVLSERVTLTQQRRRTKWFKLRPVGATAREQMKLLS